ncbi:hypothetical protein PV726_32470 [Streptomyces europaeiscabiei]|uniref:hypothetical protein n=1 Tax=Streptomyces europaeiscabiei TaxID=146819 RepID=UPI0029BECAC6|nr:hypothetical protein [Streptomyces europaeiscabiei]MDX3694973.1 hypothetical protein [Streptomyces europaeiscabiei]
MSYHARHPRSFAHRWCTPAAYTAVLVGLLPALFGGATAVMLLTLAVFAGLGLLMVTAAMLGGRNPRRRARQPHSSAARLSDAAIILVGSGLLIGALAGSGETPPSVTSGPGSSLVWALLALCVVHHLAHRRAHRRSRRY